MDYTVYYVERVQDKSAFKAELYSEPADGRKELKFPANSDMEARKYISETILPQDARGLKYVSVLSQCREKKPRDTKLILANLNEIKNPLRSEILDALQPLINDGKILNDSGKLRIYNHDREMKQVVEPVSTTGIVSQVVEKPEMHESDVAVG